MCQRDDSESDAGNKHCSVVRLQSPGPVKHIWTASKSQVEEIVEGLSPSRHPQSKEYVGNQTGGGDDLLQN